MKFSSNQAVRVAVEQLIYAGIGLAHADAAPQADMAVAVADGVIVAVGTRAELQARHPDVPLSGGSDLLLTPAFVNAADHGYGLSPFSLGLPDELLEVWVPGVAGLPPLDPFTCAAYSGVQLLRAGVSLTVHSHLPRNWNNLAAEAAATLAGYSAAGIRVAWHTPYFDQMQPVYADAARFLSRLPPGLRAEIAAQPSRPALPIEAYLAICRELASQPHELATVQLGLDHALWCSDELLRRVSAFAEAHGLPLHMAGVAGRYQSMAAQQRWNMSIPQRLARLGVLSPRLTMHQPIWMGHEDLDLLAEAGVATIYSPGSSLRQRCGIAPLAELTQRTLRIGIGTGGHALHDDQDYPGELRLAWTIANRPGADEPTVHAQDVLHMGMHGGAMAVLGAATTLGRLTPGAPADLVLHDRTAILGTEAPDHSERMAALLLRRGGRAGVRHVLVHGRWVVRDGKPLHVDEAALLERLHDDAAAPRSPNRSDAATRAQALAPYVRRFYAAWEDG